MDPKQRNVLSIVAVITLVVIAAVLFWPPQTKIRQGLDIQGGVSVILTAKAPAGEALTEDKMDRAQTVLQARVNALGASEATVQRQGNDAILVQLPGIKNQQQALRALGTTGLLEFVDVASLPASEAATIKGWDGRSPKPELKAGSYKPIFTGEVVKNANASVDQQGKPEVTLQFDATGTQKWAAYTSSHVGQQVAIVLDRQVQSAPSIREAITGGDTAISGSFTAAQVKELAAILQAGSLPVELTPANTQAVGPTLGQQSLEQGLIAALIGLALVMAFMLVFYRALGAVSWASLLSFSAIFLGVLALLSSFGAYALTLPGIAGIVLTIGVATDSSILIFERFKEEVRLGKTMRSAAKSGSRHAIGTSIDADIVTFVTAFVLFVVAIGPVRGFALTLMIGIVIDLTVAILLTRSVVIMLAESTVSKAPWLFGLKGGGDRA